VHSSMIGKVEKAMRYAHEPDRVKIQRLTATFAGDNGSHTVTLETDAWHCTCHLFESAGGCSHTLAVQKMLDPMLSDASRETPLYGHAEVAAPA
jgi:SWIM zinc finger